MRVISGTHKGRRLVAPKGLATRPTADKVKEAVFSIIAPYLHDAIFLDLFAGSGAIGIEALSQGAQKCIFIDKSRQAIEAVYSNLHATGFADFSVVHNTYAERFLKKTNLKFDIIFIDPPYAMNIAAVLGIIAEHNILADDGIIVLEQDAKTKLEQHENYRIVKEKRYGASAVTVLEKDDSFEHCVISR